MLNISMFGVLVSKLYIMDTVKLARKSPKKMFPENYKPSTLHSYCTHMDLGDSDVIVIVKMLQYKSYNVCTKWIDSEQLSILVINTCNLTRIPILMRKNPVQNLVTNNLVEVVINSDSGSTDHVDDSTVVSH
jgi:hypothetical protein